MTFKGTAINKMGGLLASTFVKNWMGTLSYQTIMYDSTVDPVLPEFEGPIIAVFWHEYFLVPFYLRGNSNTAILTSLHRDANWLAEAARHLGFEITRGSTFRGGSKALLELVRGRPRNFGIACDGPRGPRRRMAQGPIYLSSKLQIPLIPYGIGYDGPMRMKSWDQFALPRPWTKCSWVIGPRIQIPPHLSRTDVEKYRVQVENVLNCLTEEAEIWAISGQRKSGQRTAFRAPGKQGHFQKGQFTVDACRKAA